MIIAKEAHEIQLSLLTEHGSWLVLQVSNLSLTGYL